MRKRLGVTVLACLLLLALRLAPALATDTPDDAFVSPTRDPNAPEYSLDHPDELVPEQIVAQTFLLMERSTGNVLMQRDMDTVRFPASTTKIMTALIALQVGNLDDTLVISDTAMNVPEDSSMVPFKAGEVVTLRDALYGLLLRSGNEAANAIAEYVAGDINLFVEQMNETAAMLGCTNTHFVNAHGYHHELHQTTAHDLARIFSVALQNETFRQIISTYEWTLSATEVNPARKINNSNLHINPDPENNYYYSNSIGGKTGSTSQAGYVLVEAAQKNGTELIAVAMYSGKYSRWPDTSRLFSYGFTQYKSVTAEEIYDANPSVLQINGFDLEDPNIGMLELSIRPIDPSREVRFTGLIAEIDHIVDNAADYTNYVWDIEMRAPIAQGQVVGTVTFYPPNNAEPATYELLATRSIAERTNAPPTLEEIEQRVLEDPSPFPPFSWDWILPPILIAVAALFILRALFRLLRRRHVRRKQIPTPKRRTFN